MIFQQRKSIRLKNYDYSQNGVYFLTICVKNKEKLLWCMDSPSDDGQEYLSEYGKTIDNVVNMLSEVYPKIVFVDKYVIMPNHVHLLIFLNNESGKTSPTISRIIKQFKGAVTKQLGASIWQKGFYDHIIRSEDDYKNIWCYIDTNIKKWQLDYFYE